MRTIVLVSCGAEKADAAVPAKELYLSSRFRQQRTYAEKRQTDGWYILSAKHGLVDPETIVEPYDQSLMGMPKAERRAWAVQVWSQLEPRLSGIDCVVIFAGKEYREFLELYLSDRGIKVEVPLRGMRQGQQLKAMKELLR
ncbi:MAG: hypothetical protein G8345_13980 [Magnetococcales bacterium]|nr:hypothetical protein [Magnetococcales bacterium]